MGSSPLRAELLRAKVWSSYHAALVDSELQKTSTEGMNGWTHTPAYFPSAEHEEGQGHKQKAQYSAKGY